MWGQETPELTLTSRDFKKENQETLELTLTSRNFEKEKQETPELTLTSRDFETWHQVVVLKLTLTKRLKSQG